MAKKLALAQPTKKKKEPSGICFTIMPFGVYFDAYYDNIYKVAIENSGLEPRRADDLFRPSSIVSDIWDLTKRAKIILADLSGKNPNVFYELGLGHAITKPAILVAESMDDIPFDLRGLRIIVYNKNDHNWGTELRKKIEKAIREILEAPEESIPPTFLNVKGVKKAEVTPEELELRQVKSDLELLKREVRALVPRYEWPSPSQTARSAILESLRKQASQQDNYEKNRLYSLLLSDNVRQGESDKEKSAE